MPQLAMPLFPRSGSVSSAKVVAAWKRLFVDGPALALESDKDSIATFAIAGRSVCAAHMPVPVPNHEAADMVRTSWMWKGPDTPIREHRSHAIVTSMESGDPLEDAWDVARLSAALLVAGEGSALYWGNSRQVHLAQVAIGMASEMGSAPVPLFVGITISAPGREGPFSAATHGLDALGHKEFEVRGTRMGIGDLRMTLLDLSGYVLRSGPVLEHGQTFGPSADVHWSISHEPSTLVPGRDAIVLGIP
jgi:hypothetical protein